ncbi:MAG: sugar-binding transcriptional regulator [Anaerolineae bacterium]|nr:sugar-binding transcriptional regulator [Anaerolineae bacterium]
MNQKTDLLVEVARAYYERGYTQQDIAQSLGLSRSQVSRYLSEARDLHIVQIRVIDPNQRANDTELALRDVFPSLKDAVVIPLFANQSDVLLKTIGRACAEYLYEHLVPGQRLCIGSGRTLRETINWMKNWPKNRHVENVAVIQAMGSVGHEALDIDYNELAHAAADAMGGRAYYLNAPAVLGSGTAAALAGANPSIDQSLSMVRDADVYVVGVGSPATDSLYVRTGLVTAAELDAVARRGAVGDICGRFYNIRGEVCPSNFEDRVVGVRLEDLRQAPLSIGVAGGPDKVAPLLGALRGGFINMIVTDENTARQILELAHGDD